MAAEFLLEIITPERSFFCDMAEAVTLPTAEGQMSILRGHETMVISILPGELMIKQQDQWRSCSVAPGFVEVRPDETIIFTQSAEWPEEIDVRRAEEARQRAEERLRQKLSEKEYKSSKVALARAMTRLSLSKRKFKM